MSLRSRIYACNGLLIVVCCVASLINWVGPPAVLSKIDEQEQAETSEFVNDSGEVNHMVDRREKRLSSVLTAAANRTRTLCFVASLASLVFAALLAARLSHSILEPISSLTDALRRLDQGESLADLPGTDRDDEIGRLSRAARALSAKHQETQDLLVRSQSRLTALARKTKALEETNLELENFAHVASHDLKAPLHAINSLAQWVYEDCNDLLPEDSQRQLVQLLGRVEKMQNLLDELLEYSRVGRIEQQSETVALGDLVRSVIEMCEHREGVEVRVAMPLPKIRTAIAPLKQVLLNLITNAIKYGDQGTIDVSGEELDAWIRITIVDNGRGIDPQSHDRVFQMFQRDAPHDCEGSGMGLAIVKKQVEYYGGSVTLKSQLLVGSEFSFTWPKDTGMGSADSPLIDGGNCQTCLPLESAK